MNTTTTTTSSSLQSTESAGVTIKNIIEPEDDIVISKLNASTTPTKSYPTSRPRLSRTKSIQSHHINGCSVRRSRFASFRSKSLDNDNNIERNRHRRSLNKSKTLHYLSSSSRMMRNAENSNGCCQNGGNINNNYNNRRIRLFDMTVDQSPLWTTLTHARTLSDFSAES